MLFQNNNKFIYDFEIDNSPAIGSHHFYVSDNGLSNYAPNFEKVSSLKLSNVSKLVTLSNAEMCTFLRDLHSKCNFHKLYDWDIKEWVNDYISDIQEADTKLKGEYSSRFPFIDIDYRSEQIQSLSYIEDDSRFIEVDNYFPEFSWCVEDCLWCRLHNEVSPYTDYVNAVILKSVSKYNYYLTAFKVASNITISEPLQYYTIDNLPINELTLAYLHNPFPLERIRTSITHLLKCFKHFNSSTEKFNEIISKVDSIPNSMECITVPYTYEDVSSRYIVPKKEITITREQYPLLLTDNYLQAQYDNAPINDYLTYEHYDINYFTSINIPRIEYKGFSLLKSNDSMNIAVYGNNANPFYKFNEFTPLPIDYSDITQLTYSVFKNETYEVLEDGTCVLCKNVPLSFLQQIPILDITAYQDVDTNELMFSGSTKEWFDNLVHDIASNGMTKPIELKIFNNSITTKGCYSRLLVALLLQIPLIPVKFYTSNTVDYLENYSKPMDKELLNSVLNPYFIFR